MVSGTVLAELFPEYTSWLLHQLILRVSLLDNTRLKSAWSIGDFASGDLIEHREAVVSEVVDVAQRELHPRGQEILACAREADLAWLFVVQQGRAGGSDANQIVGQDRRPDFAANHLGRLAANMSEIQRVLDTADIEFRIPTKAIQRCDVFLRVLVVIDERRDDVDAMSTSTGCDNAVTDLSQLEPLRDLGIGFFVHPFRTLWTDPFNDVIILSQTLAASKIGMTRLMFSGAGVYPLLKQQRNHHERAIVAIHHRDIAG